MPSVREKVTLTVPYRRATSASSQPRIDPKRSKRAQIPMNSMPVPSKLPIIRVMKDARYSICDRTDTAA